MKRIASVLFVFAALSFASAVVAAELTDEMKEQGWKSIFDGKTFDGWKSNEKYDGFKIEDGCIVGFGNKNNLYYMNEEFKNFEVMMDVKISEGGNSGVFVKSQWQDGSWPTSGFEVQINATHGDPIKTGSIWNIVNLPQAAHNDNEWFTLHIICLKNTLQVRVNGTTLYTYVDPREKEGPQGPISEATRRISQKGYLNLQQHDPKSIPMFKNIFVKALAD